MKPRQTQVRHLGLIPPADGPRCLWEMHPTGRTRGVPTDLVTRRLRATAPTKAISQIGIVRPSRWGSNGVTPHTLIFLGGPQSPGDLGQMRSLHL